MLIQQNPPLHLTYCMNVHAGETWADHLAAIRTHAVAVRGRVAADRRFGLGLRIGAKASEELADPRAVKYFRDLLAEHQLYGFTINGFPYGNFHTTRVKETVYRPDWRTSERRDYTNRLADILAALLPGGVEGSISTVPVSFKPWMAGTADVERATGMLLECVQHLDHLHRATGKLIHLGLEPEPCCTLETTDEFVGFYKALLARGPEDLVRRHIGVCLDTCHVAIQFEDLCDAIAKYRREGIRISKMQLSAALECDGSARDALKPFVEPVYFHQVKTRAGDGSIRSWTDLPDALAEGAAGTLRVHFHVPLFWEGSGPLRSTAACLTPDFWQLVREGVSSHLEIETYTFDVLPDALRKSDVVESIAREFTWVLSRLTTN
ncbi:MAG: metabolite traffic protein EboE [bacterium]